MLTSTRLNNYSYLTEAIKDSVSFEKAASYYGLNFNRAGFALCPFHAEKTPSFKAFQDGGHCFGCGWHGDVINFVRDMFGLTFPAALEKINDDFCLALPINRTLTLREQRDAQRRHNELLAERERREAEKQAYEDLYWKLWDEWCRLDRNRMAYAPQNLDEEWNPLFVEALQKIDYQSYLIDTLL